MRVARLEIKNFRGIKSASLDFDGHTLLLGMNNVGKSSVCEALELALGPERLYKFPPVEEFDFYNAQYLEADGVTAIPIQIEVTLIDLSEEVAKKCAPHTHHWRSDEKRVLTEGEVDLVDDQRVCECLRLRAIAKYNLEEDEFEAETVFVDGPTNAEGELSSVNRNIKRLFGFLYLRALRTGSRALSLERGSLLDVIVKQRKIRTGIWESSIQRLRDLDPPIDEGAADLAPVLENIEKRVGQYIHLETEGRATQLFVSQLTREHLRKTISFFLKTSVGQDPVPFQKVGTGTLNTLVLALLTFIAEIKKDNVIFAMEEPEIALPPHTQRRIANYLLQNTTQCLVTSHSPYLIERFDPSQIQILRKDQNGILTASSIPGSSVLKGKTYRRHARRGLAEAMLGRAVIVCEGITEKDAVLATADKMEDADSDSFYPLDLSGVTVISTDGDGSMPEFGAFFKAIQVKAFALYDDKKRTTEEEEKFKLNFDIGCQTEYAGTELLLVEEIPVNRLWDFLVELRDSGEKPALQLPPAMPAANEVKALAYSVLEKEKGSGYSGRLINCCDFTELPVTILDFLRAIYALFPKPAAIPPIETTMEDAAAGAEQVPGGAAT
ncbi:MAG: AAA family ATPase [Acidobacteriia bacterium]|nr:AAA family ATPase [Terriglobia bacterium]